MAQPEHPSLASLEEVLTSPHLSHKAKGVFASLCFREAAGLPMSRADLAREGTDGAMAIASAMRELQDQGYVEVLRVRKGGRFVAGRRLHLRRQSTSE